MVAVDTRRRFNVDKTLYNVARHRIDLKGRRASPGVALYQKKQ